MENKKRPDEGSKKALQRPKMPIDQRAKQFMPFKAVTGLDVALREKEREIEERETYERV